MTWKQSWQVVASVVVLLSGAAPAVLARPDQQMLDEFQAAHPEYFQHLSTGGGRVQPAAIPDIYGPGSVLTVGNVYMKVTNYATIGNPFTNISSDPSGQWPGASGIEYLSYLLLSVGGVNPTATDPIAVRRVSYFSEWRPPTLDPEDKMYRSFDGIINGARLVNDDNDYEVLTGEAKIDEDFLDGRDNDGDNRIDEDYGALGQQMYSCVMRDDTPAAINTVFNEKHIPLGLECRLQSWAYSVPGFTDFDPIEFTIYNRSGHTLDSMLFGFRIDMDCGPLVSSTFFSDDFDLPYAPQGDFLLALRQDDPRIQKHFNPQTNAIDTLCPRLPIKVRGFSVVDDDGDESKTPGTGSLLLLGHTVDPLGLRAPARTGWRAYRSYVGGTPYTDGGNPTIDQQRFEFMASNQNIDPETGFITQEPGDQKGDYQAWASVGPFLQVPDGGSITCTLAFSVNSGTYKSLSQYRQDYLRYAAGIIRATDLFDKYPIVENAFTAQVAYEGVYELPRVGLEAQVPGGNCDQYPFGCHGNETRLKLEKGSAPELVPELCSGRDAVQKLVTDNAFTWFDFDCDFCTGVWDEFTNQGYYLRHWNAESPPPNPNLNVAATYNYSDNPDRLNPSGDNSITLGWDNLSETTPDPKSGMFDFRSYRVWKVSNWQRPVGSSGPNDDDWALLEEFRLFDHADSNKVFSADSGRAVCPQVYVPNLSVNDLVLLKSSFPTEQSARSWASGHGYEWADTTLSDGSRFVRLVDEGAQWRIHQEILATCRSDNFHVKDLDVGVTAEICEIVTAQSKGVEVPICLYRGDFWDQQSGLVLRPESSVDCMRKDGACVEDSGRVLGTDIVVRKARYPVGRYRFVDREVKNGFVYFYSVTAGDSTGQGASLAELSGRRSAVEADAVVPQASVQGGKGVWVVPNPYRGYQNISERPSSWDLIPNASDPTGTHVDFMGMPSGKWTIRIFTVSGDLVAELHSDDPVNDSVRSPVSDDQGVVRPGYNRQQDNSNDGQARWNLISRNGQDVVSGIYVFVVKSDQGDQRGRFVIIR